MRFSKAKSICAIAAACAAIGFGGAAMAKGTLRIAMTTTDIPLTTGAPDNGYEGIRFVGYPVFESLVLWDLSRDDRLAGLAPGLAESWKQDPNDRSKWILQLRKGVKFHDGSEFTADAAIWNLERLYNKSSKQFDPAGGAIAQARVPYIIGYRKIDDASIEISTPRPLSYFPNMLPYLLFISPAQFEKAGSYAEFAKAPSGTGPFKVSEVKPRVSVTMVRNDGYWNKARVPKLDRMIVFPMPEATTRLAALRSGQVDWIEVPPPDAVPSLKSSGFVVTQGSYPHNWPFEMNLAKPGPWQDVRVRHALNYCINRQGLVSLLNGLAEPAAGIFKKTDPQFGKPKQQYTYDPAKAKALLKEAGGYGPDKPITLKLMISTSGSGQMQSLPMNEFLQQNLKECGFNIVFEVVEFGAMMVALRNSPMAPQALGVDAANISLPPSTDISQLALFFLSNNAAPKGRNWSNWKNADFDAAIDKVEKATDPAEVLKYSQEAHAILVDDAPWIFIVHDVNPRAMTKKVKGFIGAQSWFMDFSGIEME